MDVELELPTEPVALAPGVPVRVPVGLRNPAGRTVGLRLAVARGRVAAWASVDPPAVELDGGASTTVDVVLQAPPDQPPSPSFVPFTVHAEDAGSGEPAGFATGLVRVALPVPVTGELVARAGARHAYDLRLANDGGGDVPLLVTAELDPPAGTVGVEPDALRLEPGEARTVAVRARPGRPWVGAPRPYTVLVTVADAHDGQAAPYVRATAAGRRRARLPTWALATVAVLLALGATAAIALSGVRLPLPGRRAPAPAAAAPTPAPAAAAPPAVTVTRPYVVVQVFPHAGADGGRAAAQAEFDRLTRTGMPVRLVDSLASDVLADPGGGFWVLLQDGFPGVPAAQAFCTTWRPVAPTCRVAP